MEEAPEVNDQTSGAHNGPTAKQGGAEGKREAKGSQQTKPGTKEMEVDWDLCPTRRLRNHQRVYRHTASRQAQKNQHLGTFLSPHQPLMWICFFLCPLPLDFTIWGFLFSSLRVTLVCFSLSKVCHTKKIKECHNRWKYESVVKPIPSYLIGRYALCFAFHVSLKCPISPIREIDSAVHATASANLLVSIQ